MNLALVHRGHPVDDMREVWWLHDARHAYVAWSDRPWTAPTASAIDDQGVYAYEVAIGEAGGVAYGGPANAREDRRRPDGVLVLHDPQVFTGSVWLLLDPAREVTPPGSAG